MLMRKKSKLPRRNRQRNSFYQRHFKFAASIGSITALIVYLAARVCLDPEMHPLIIGLLAGDMLYNFYLGVMADIELDRERRRTFNLSDRGRNHAA